MFKVGDIVKLNPKTIDPHLSSTELFVLVEISSGHYGYYLSNNNWYLKRRRKDIILASKLEILLYWDLYEI